MKYQIDIVAEIQGLYISINKCPYFNMLSYKVILIQKVIRQEIFQRK